MRRKLGANQKEVGNRVVHTKQSIEETGAEQTTDVIKIRKFILAGKIPNGTNGVFI